MFPLLIMPQGLIDHNTGEVKVNIGAISYDKDIHSIMGVSVYMNFDPRIFKVINSDRQNNWPILPHEMERGSRPGETVDEANADGRFYFQGVKTLTNQQDLLNIEKGVPFLVLDITMQLQPNYPRGRTFMGLGTDPMPWNDSYSFETKLVKLGGEVFTMAGVTPIWILR